MSLFGNLKHKSTVDEISIAPSAPSADVSDEDLEFVKGRAESAEDVINAYNAKLKAEAEAKAAMEAALAAQKEEKETETMMPEEDNQTENTEIEYVYQKVPVIQHELVLDLPEFHPSDEPAIAVIRGDEGFLAKDLVSGIMALGRCESEARERLNLLLAQPA